MYKIFVLFITGLLYQHPPTDLQACREKVEQLFAESYVVQGACIGGGDYYYFDPKTDAWERTVFIDHST